jgi:hypothetical protein
MLSGGVELSSQLLAVTVQWDCVRERPGREVILRRTWVVAEDGFRLGLAIGRPLGSPGLAQYSAPYGAPKSPRVEPSSNYRVYSLGEQFRFQGVYLLFFYVRGFFGLLQKVH